MKKTLLLSCIIILITLLIKAQSPEVLNYQGVLKNPDGSIRPNTEAVIKLEFVQDNILTYSETHLITTNANGYFAIHPGAGEATLGKFNEIDWSITPVVMRTILDGNTIAQTHLTSVPYALYAQRLKGQEDIYFSIDSLGQTHEQTSWLVDELVLDIDTLQQVDDSISTSLHSTQLLLDSTTHDLYALYVYTAQQDSIREEQIDYLNNKTDSISVATPFFNATAYATPTDGIYHTARSARECVPTHIRRGGLVVTFRSDSINWRSIQYAHNDTTQWNNDNSWREYGMYGNITLSYLGSDSLTRMQIPLEHRRQGLIISYFNNDIIINEQYTAPIIDDSTWGNDSSWMQLLLTSREIDRMNAEIARIDTLVNDVKKGLQDMSTFGAWFYIDHNEKFSQAGAFNYTGDEISDIKLVHTQLIPINDQWFVTSYGNKQYPAISFYATNDPKTRIPSIYDSNTGDEWQQHTIDFSTDEIPAYAQFFSVNMVIEHKDKTTLKLRTPITNVIDTSIKYNFKDEKNVFNYIGAYVGCNGKRTINSQFRHSRFISLDDIVYKVNTVGAYNEGVIAPIIVYYSDASFSCCVGYDLGEVMDNGTTSRETIISRQTAPEDANYFIINWMPSEGDATLQSGRTSEDILYDTDNRLSIVESNLSCYTNRKLVTLGDSFTINGGNRGKHWQQWLVEWLGVNWSSQETSTGVNGYAPMGMGATWVIPNDINALSIRCRDIRRYSPNIILVFGGQNDKVDSLDLGTIDDEPFIINQVIDLAENTDITSVGDAINYMENNNTKHLPNTLIHINTPYGKKLYFITDYERWNEADAWFMPIDSVSFYSAYKGMLQQICSQNPFATICCLTLLQCDETKYDGSLGEWEYVDALRRAKCEAIKEIAAFYGVGVIDLWNQSGITHYNAPSLYDDWLHPNQYGYRRMAECIYHELK